MFIQPTISGRSLSTSTLNLSLSNVQNPVKRWRNSLLVLVHVLTMICMIRAISADMFSRTIRQQPDQAESSVAIVF
jgi:hypothetical protein